MKICKDMAQSMVLVSFISLLLIPLPAAGLSLARVKYTEVSAPLALRHSSLPAGDENLLRKVEQGVKALKVPSRLGASGGSSGALQSCSFLGGLVTADLSARCCVSVQVSSQKYLSHYGLAQSCKPGWTCSADGKTPTASFQAQAVSEMCSESGCLNAVVGAMRGNWMVKKGADDMGAICTSAGLNGSGAAPLSALVHGKSRGPTDDISEEEADHRALKLECEEEVCDVKDKLKKLCHTDKDKKDQCYKFCCVEKDHAGLPASSGCFAGEATADVQGRGAVAMAQLRVGDQVLVESSGQLAYEPVLSFLHVVHPAPGKKAPFLTIVHSHGKFQATENHIVFVADPEGGSNRVSKLVGKLLVGDELFIARHPARREFSQVSAILRSNGEMGLYAPLTASGTIVVDGVVASNYASPSVNKELSHRAAHVFLLPVRVYHFLGLRRLLASFWQGACSHGSSHSQHWLCQGSSENAAASEEMHPYIAVMYNGLRFDWFLG